ncbi:IS110 family transposase [Aequorivita sp. F47161]|uniref:IS110 family transposase n=1 Tax=Aequorivita vitellina TaxID=2874475 RepID=A0A9X1U339_9FLAO|nr:IS110 family transposase [Aequorivita vitellina]MCG2420545.1 IS110 family transposase [Aequorivita vitellina]
MKNTVIGIDISKDSLDYCSLGSHDVQVKSRGVLENHGKTIHQWLESFDRQLAVFALEHTGHYGAVLMDALSEKGFKFYMINPLELKKSLGIQRGKSDSKDAYRIAEYAITNKHKLSPYHLPSDNLAKLKALVTARERYVKMSVQVQNSLKANEILNKTIDVRMLIKEEKKQYRSLQRSIANIEAEMQRIIKSDQELKKSYAKVTAIIGVGPVIATKCITETANFTRFQDPRKFSCHCGLAPFPYRSGSSIRGRTRTHYLRDRSMKAVLTKGALTAVQHDPQLKNYYERKISEGKHHMSVVNAVANKLVLRIFAIAKREEPFVKLSN